MGKLDGDASPESVSYTRLTLSTTSNPGKELQLSPSFDLPPSFFYLVPTPFVSSRRQLSSSLRANLVFTRSPRFPFFLFSQTMPPFFNMRRFSRSNSIHNRESPQSPPTSFTPPLTHAPMMPNGTAGSQQGSHQSRPVSANTSSSFDFANRPPAQYQMSTLPSNTIGNLSRTDQVVLRHFWEVKNEENKGRDLHFVSCKPRCVFIFASDKVMTDLTGPPSSSSSHSFLNTRTTRI